MHSGCVARLEATQGHMWSIVHDENPTSSHPIANCINFSTCQIDKLMQFR
jgi:hypothetical protein